MNTKNALLYLILFCFAYTLSAQNIMINNSGNPVEPSIKINPKNPNIIVAGSNLNFYYYSADTGRTWQQERLVSSFGVWGDPVIDVDTAGHFYFLHLSNPSTGNWIDRIVVQKSTDDGQTWSDGSFMGLNGSRAQDKQWSIINPETNHIFVTWTEFDEYGSVSTADSSRIMFSKSLDAGLSWTPAKAISRVNGNCIDEDETVEGAVPTLGPNGELYVCWAGPSGIVFSKSEDEGETWLASEIPVNDMPGGWDYAIPGLLRANGLPITRCDLSGGPNHGTIYVNWTDQRNGTDDTDVWLAKSTDGGLTWTEEIRVNDDPAGKHQFLTWMDIDPTTGHLYFIFYDRRNYTGNETDVYLAISQDGGQSFINRRISESPFVPTSQVFFGDYNNISVYNGIVRPIWTRMEFGMLSIWTDVTPLSVLLNTEQVQSSTSITTSTFPNPSNYMSFFSFKLHTTRAVSLDLVDANGKRIYRHIDDQKYGYGKYVERIDLNQLELPSGMYYYRLTLDGVAQPLKPVIVAH